MADAKEEPAPGTKLFIGGLSWDTTDVQFATYFSRFGAVKDAMIMRVKMTGASRGFGFVTFDDASSAQKVLDGAAAGELELDGRKFDPKIAVPRTPNQRRSVGVSNEKTKKIFVGGLSPDTNQDSLREYFSAYGTVAQTMVMMDQATGRSRGFGFVTFESEESVDNVMNVTNHSVNDKAVECKRAIPKSNIAPRQGGRMGGWGGPPPGAFGGFGPGFGPGYGGDFYGNRGGYGQQNGGYGGGYGQPGGYQQDNRGYGQNGSGYSNQGAEYGAATTAGGQYGTAGTGAVKQAQAYGAMTGGQYGGMQQQYDQSGGYGAYNDKSAGSRNFRSYHPYR
jgi:heterogeneous nuclear ribonucleoprotein A1/A3